MQDMAGDVGGDDYAGGGSGGGGGHAQGAEPEGQPSEQRQEQPEGEQAENQRGVDQLGSIETSMGDKLDGPRRTLPNSETGHYTMGNSLPYHGQQPVARPATTGNMAANADHPLMANYRSIIQHLQEPK
jgi:hypothetical protein